MLAFVALLLTALTFALLAYAADRKGNHIIATMLAGGTWLFAGIGLLIGVLIWV